jgi:hypothetical protein
MLHPTRYPFLTSSLERYLQGSPRKRRANDHDLRSILHHKLFARSCDLHALTCYLSAVRRVLQQYTTPPLHQAGKGNERIERPLGGHAINVTNVWFWADYRRSIPLRPPARLRRIRPSRPGEIHDETYSHPACRELDDRASNPRPTIHPGRAAPSADQDHAPPRQTRSTRVNPAKTDRTP